VSERFVRSINEERLTKFILVGQASLRPAITEYMTHFHEERNHQGLENRLMRERSVVAVNDASSIVGYGSMECSAFTIESLRERFVRFCGHYPLAAAIHVLRACFFLRTER
jgi:hypothetical protein